MADASVRKPEPQKRSAEKRRADALRPNASLDVDGVSKKLIAKFPKILAKLAE